MLVRRRVDWLLCYGGKELLLCRWAWCVGGRLLFDGNLLIRMETTQADRIHVQLSVKSGFVFSHAHEQDLSARIVSNTSPQSSHWAFPSNKLNNIVSVDQLLVIHVQRALGSNSKNTFEARESDQANTTSIAVPDVQQVGFAANKAGNINIKGHLHEIFH